MKQVRTMMAIQIDYDRRLILTAEQAAVVLKAIQGAAIHKSCYQSDGGTVFYPIDEVLRVELIREDRIFDSEEAAKASDSKTEES